MQSRYGAKSIIGLLYIYLCKWYYTKTVLLITRQANLKSFYDFKLACLVYTIKECDYNFVNVKSSSGIDDPVLNLKFFIVKVL